MSEEKKVRVVFEARLHEYRELAGQKSARLTGPRFEIGILYGANYKVLEGKLFRVTVEEVESGTDVPYIVEGLSVDSSIEEEEPS